MKQSKNSAIEATLRNLVGQTVPMLDNGDQIMVHELYGECVGEFFFLLENKRTQEFFTRPSSHLVQIVQFPRRNSLDSDESPLI